MVAGGLGRRFGGSIPKQFLEIGGEPVLLRAVRAFAEHPDVASTVVVLPEQYVAESPAWLHNLGVRIVGGGVERGDSVWNGICALPEDLDPVLVHDGARPFVTADLISRVIAAARASGAVAAVPVADTLKRADADNRVLGTVERAELWHAQTPQGFPRSLLLRAFAQARADGVQGTDEAMLVERLGETVRVVPGSVANLKITRPEDLILAEALARRLA